MRHIEVKLKFIIVGDSTVGKTSLLYRFSNNKFKDDQQPTIGIDFFSHSDKRITSTGVLINLRANFWDTAGQEIFRSITRQYYRGAAGVLLVYDVTNLSSFENIDDWISEIAGYTSCDCSVLYVIGNKYDLEHKREIDDDKIEDLLKKLRTMLKCEIKHYYASAKTSYNIQLIFNNIINDMYGIIMNNFDGPYSDIFCNNKGVTIRTYDETSIDTGIKQKKSYSKCC